MNQFQFEQSPWEALIDSHPSNSRLDALTLLTMLEGENDDTIEDAFFAISEKGIYLDLSSFPKNIAAGQAALRLKQEEEYIKQGLIVSDLEENDPLRLYLEEIASIPAFGDEELLAQQTAAGDENAAVALANLGLAHVVHIAKEFVGHNVLLLDLIQEGSIGLWQGIHNYKGIEYAAHRDKMIRNAMAKAVMLQANSNGIGQKIRQALQDYRSTDEKLLVELGRNPTLEEIADAMHMTVEDAQSVKKMLEDAMLLKQAESSSEPEPDNPEDTLAVEDTAYFQMRQRIGELLSQLDDASAQLLTLRFGLDNGLPLSTEETAQKLGITTGEVAAKEALALAKLRNNEKG